MPTPLILARSFREAHAFAKDNLELPVGHYRVVNTPGTLKAVRNVDLHLVPGWDKSPTHFAMKGALRYCKGLNIIDHAQPVVNFECSECEYTSDEFGDTHTHTTPAPVETDFFDDVTLSDEPEPTATCTTCGLDPHDPECFDAVRAEAVAQVTQDDEPETPVEKPKAKRRTRCKKCGNLHYKTDPCPEAE